MAGTLDLDYPTVQRHLAPYMAEGRTESRAFLAWFLENYYRLDRDSALDAVCDGCDDKGIDGIYVDDNLERIDVFQSKLIQNPDRTLGDRQLKEFVGTLAQPDDPDTVENIIATTSNLELKILLETESVASKIKDGYSVYGVFLINIRRDANAEQYLSTQPSVIVYDVGELEGYFVPTGPSVPRTNPVTFNVSGYDVAEYNIADTKIFITPLVADDLLKLDDIASGLLFIWNVRQSLGRTKVNREIGNSIETQAEHKNFLLYHNGLTILCKEINRIDDMITISDYAVVNGCQSLTSLWEHRNKVTEDLRILTRLIELDPASELARKITQNSNNQNSINARDLQSNSTLQRRLQNEFTDAYNGCVFYRTGVTQLTTGHRAVASDTSVPLLG